MTWPLLATLPIAALAQAGSGAGAPQTFEVASVRPSGPDPGVTSFADALTRVRVMPGGRFVATFTSLETLIRFAYALQTYEVLDGGRSRLIEQKFDVNAASGASDVSVTPAGVIGPVNVMLQNLLAERFRLRVRWEEPEQPVLVLVRARADGKLGPGLRASSVDCADPETRKKVRPSDAFPVGCTFRASNGRIQAAGHQLSTFADYLSSRLQRPVLDRTNLDGPFAIDMTSSSEGIPIPPLAAQLGSTPVRTDDADPRPPLATALKEQLGLALEMRREPVRRLVIEHVEPPSPN
jgi:uncharacterized protein (TIGR03435 family)